MKDVLKRATETDNSINCQDKKHPVSGTTLGKGSLHSEYQPIDEEQCP